MLRRTMTKEALIENGFKYIGEINGFECVAKEIDDCEGEFAYHLINKDGRTIFQFAQTSSLDTVKTLNFIANRLFNLN